MTGWSSFRSVHSATLVTIASFLRGGGLGLGGRIFGHCRLGGWGRGGRGRRLFYGFRHIRLRAAAGREVDDVDRRGSLAGLLRAGRRGTRPVHGHGTAVLGQADVAESGARVGRQRQAHLVGRVGGPPRRLVQRRPAHGQQARLRAWDHPRLDMFLKDAGQRPEDPRVGPHHEQGHVVVFDARHVGQHPSVGRERAPCRRACGVGQGGQASGLDRQRIEAAGVVRVEPALAVEAEVEGLAIGRNRPPVGQASGRRRQDRHQQTHDHVTGTPHESLLRRWIPRRPARRPVVLTRLAAGGVGLKDNPPARLDEARRGRYAAGDAAAKAVRRRLERRGARAAEWVRLETVCTRKGTQGSNPCLSAIIPSGGVTPRRLPSRNTFHRSRSPAPPCYNQVYY